MLISTLTLIKSMNRERRYCCQNQRKQSLLIPSMFLHRLEHLTMHFWHIRLHQWSKKYEDIIRNEVRDTVWRTIIFYYFQLKVLLCKCKSISWWFISDHRDGNGRVNIYGSKALYLLWRYLPLNFSPSQCNWCYWFMVVFLLLFWWILIWLFDLGIYFSALKIVYNDTLDI